MTFISDANFAELCFLLYFFCGVTRVIWYMCSPFSYLYFLLVLFYIDKTDCTLTSSLREAARFLRRR